MVNRKQPILHLITWGSILLLFLLLASKGGEIRYDLIVAIVYFGIINIGVFYINYLHLLPAFLSRKKYLLFGIALIVLLIASGLVKYALALYFKEEILIRASKNHKLLTFWEYYFGAVLISTFFVFLSSALRFAVDWFNNEKLRRNLENEKLLAELAFLRSQINPHFLFNSLNNIYSLTYQKSEKAPESILKLADIMRYMLNESNESFVPLAKEMEYLKNYIELQKLRFKDGGFVELRVSGDSSPYKIAPLILIAFVENAFKHGDATDLENPIVIVCNISNGMINFKATNKKCRQNKEEASGVGLKNVQRRLDLLYPCRHALQIVDNPTAYSCELSLVL